MSSTLKLVLGAILILTPVWASAAGMTGPRKDDCAQASSDYEQHELGCAVDTATLPGLAQ